MRAVRSMALAAAMLLPSAAMAQKAPPVPKGPNDTVYGKPEEFMVEGPARVCMNSSGFDLAAGEVSYLAYMGIHYASLVIRGPIGDVTISESDTYADPKSTGVPVAIEGAKVRYLEAGARTKYHFYAWSEVHERDQLLLTVTGLRGTRQDLAFLRRIAPQAMGKDCKRIFAYGLFFDDE